MPAPMVVTVPHRLGRTEAKRRLEDGIGRIREHVAAHASAVEHAWSGDRLDFRVVAAGQTVTGRIEVLDESVRVEVDLPWLLAMLGTRIGERIRKTGLTLLTKG